jgi:transcriptional regulator with XRE-family HTH domain
MKRRNVNTRWFKERFEQIGADQIKIAKILGIERASLSRSIHGKRKFTSDELSALANHLGVSIEDVMRNAGTKTPETETPKNLRIEGWIDGDLILRKGKPRGPQTAPHPMPKERDLKAARIQSAGSRFEGFDGALVYYRESSRFDPECMGRLCLVQISGDPDWKLRVLRRGYQAGSFNLAALNGELLEEGVAVAATGEVLWMRL